MRLGPTTLLTEFHKRAGRAPLQPVDPFVRLLARLIDNLVLFGAAGVATVLHLALPEGGWWDVPWDHSDAATKVLFVVYELGALLLAGRTVGKWSQDARVASATTGGRPSTVQCVVRAAALGAAISLPRWNSLVTLAVVLPVFYDGLGLHDRLARTVVTAEPEPEPDAAPTTPA